VLEGDGAVGEHELAMHCWDVMDAVGPVGTELDGSVVIDGSVGGGGGPDGLAKVGPQGKKGGEMLDLCGVRAGRNPHDRPGSERGPDQDGRRRSDR
jgi:hypothetical protein